MKILIITAFVFFSNLVSAQDLAFDAKKSGEERRAKKAFTTHTTPYRFDIKNNTKSNCAEIKIELAEATDSLSLELFDEFGQNMQTVFEGMFPRGVHNFQVIPKSKSSKPYIAIFKVAGNVESMKVVKFNSR